MESVQVNKEEIPSPCELQWGGGSKCTFTNTPDSKEKKDRKNKKLGHLEISGKRSPLNHLSLSKGRPQSCWGIMRRRKKPPLKKYPKKNPPKTPAAPYIHSLLENTKPCYSHPLNAKQAHNMMKLKEKTKKAGSKKTFPHRYVFAIFFASPSMSVDILKTTYPGSYFVPMLMLLNMTCSLR